MNLHKHTCVFAHVCTTHGLKAVRVHMCVFECPPFFQMSLSSRPRMLVSKQNTFFGKVSVHLRGVGWEQGVGVWRMGYIQARAVNEDT